MSEKIYRVQMNSKGMPNFSTAIEVEPKQADDLISRADALSKLCLNHRDVVYIDKRETAERIKAIPSAQPKQGEWIDRGMRVPSSWVKKCSLCGHETDTWRWCKYCPNCGADMRERKESE